MTQMPSGGAVPEFTLGDRLNRALKHGDVSVAEMAEYLDVHRNTISAYLNDRQAVKRQTLMLWAMRTGVSLAWLEDGGASGPMPPNGPQGRRPDQAALRQLTAKKRARSAPQSDTETYVAAAA